MVLFPVELNAREFSLFEKELVVAGMSVRQVPWRKVIYDSANRRKISEYKWYGQGKSGKWRRIYLRGPR